MARNSAREIGIYLFDGDIKGLAESWFVDTKIRLYRVPREKLYSEEVKNNKDLKKDGIYFLFGKSKEGKSLVYVGQARSRKNKEGVLLRVIEHENDRHSEYFTEAIILVDKNDEFGLTEISYLENKFANIIKEAGVYELTNANEPSSSNVTKGKKAMLDNVVEDVKDLLEVLGHRMFDINREHTLKESKQDKEEGIVLYLSEKVKSSARHIEAKCLRKSEKEYIVLAGSGIEESSAEYIRDSLKELKVALIEKGIIKAGVLLEDIVFTSSSSAASFVVGSSRSGNEVWKDENSVKLGDLFK